MNKDSVTENDAQKSHKRSRDVESDVADDAAAQLAKLKSAGMNIGDQVAAYVQKQPLTTEGIAAGVGFFSAARAP
jgi:ElaB/YqjD/DUF883 family membrane-anchored ribosome-binding protein